MVRVYGPGSAGNLAMRRRQAFTLVELLVVVAVLALLMAILLPSLGRARASAKRAACASNLKQIGVALRLHINRKNDRLPRVSFLPSMGPFPLEGEKPIRIVDVLKEEIDGETAVFLCPNDVPGGFREPPNNGKSYFETEGSSYEYRWPFGGQTLDEVSKRIQNRFDTAVGENTIWIMRDYDNFHGEPGKPGARRYLYIDGHVADYENF